MANTLFLRLEGPMQSWGERARWSVRDTALEPTKSGIVGLLGCALGWNRDEDLRVLSRQVRVGVRVDRAGIVMNDYHTIIGGVLSAEGKVKINSNTKEPETVVTSRAYLFDASFLAAVQADEEQIDRLAGALQAPVWSVYLGRKACPPSCPIYAGVGNFNSLYDALKAYPWCGRATETPKPLRIMVEADGRQGVRRRDNIDSNQMRTFLPRFTIEDLVSPPVVKEEPCIFLD